MAKCPLQYSSRLLYVFNMKFEIDRLKYNSRDHQSFYRYKKKIE